MSKTGTSMLSELRRARREEVAANLRTARLAARTADQRLDDVAALETEDRDAEDLDDLETDETEVPLDKLIR